MSRTDRRGFLQGAALIGAAFACPGAAVALSGRTQATRVAGVGATYNEQAYLDFNGLDQGYRAPAGLRGLAATSHLDEAQFRMAHPYT